MSRPLDIVIFGLSLSSSWGNGHATTYRALARGLDALGHRVLFLERDVPWYAGNRDLPEPDFCRLDYYDDIDEVLARHTERLRATDAVIVGSYMPEGVTLIDRLGDMGLDQLCFYDIDTPVTMAKLAGGDEEYLARRQVPRFDTYFSFSGGEVLDRLETEFGARHAEALYCSVDAGRYHPMPAAPRRWDLGYLGTYSEDRQPTLERLLIEPARRLPQLRFVVAGPQYPRSIRWPANVERIEHLPPSGHPAFYAAQRFTLNVTRADMIAAGWSPSVRLFEAAACGTPIVSDYWRGLSDLFPENEAIFVGRSSEDVVRLLTETDEGQRNAIAERARAIVLADHTGDARARQLAAMLTFAPSGRNKALDQKGAEHVPS